MRVAENVPPVLEVRDLKKHFPVQGGFFGKSDKKVHAVDGLDFEVFPGETVGLVGESGCGKTTLIRTITGQYAPTSGSILYEGADVLSLARAGRMNYRRNVQMVCQDPYSSLDPRMTVEDIVGEPLYVHMRSLSKGERLDKIHKMLEMVGLRPRDAKRYPHEFSGGQRQRIGIARALILEPKLVLCDEPVSALDVSIQSQVLNLFTDLQEVFDAAYIFVAHSLHVIKHVSRRVVVMYLGRVMERGTRDDVFGNPLHPYTAALMGAVPIPDPRASRERTRVALKGEVPSAVNPPAGCAFCTRCSLVTDRCRTERPQLRELKEGRWVACLKYE